MDWQWPRSLTLSDLNDEATNLRASAAARRAAQVPLHEVLEDLPQHFLLPAQGDPELWAVHVKVSRTTRTSINGSHSIAWPQGSSHFSTCTLLHPHGRRSVSPASNHVRIFSARDPGGYIHRRSTMRRRRCCPPLGDRIQAATVGPPGRMLKVTHLPGSTVLGVLQWRMGALSPRVIP